MSLAAATDAFQLGNGGNAAMGSCPVLVEGEGFYVAQQDTVLWLADGLDAGEVAQKYCEYCCQNAPKLHHA